MGEIIELACRAGKIIVENGGETYRAEDTMRYVCAAFGVDECDCYATPTTIIISTNHGGEALSRMMRIKKRGVDLHKVELVNQFSRTIARQPMDAAEAEAVLAEIDGAPPYRLSVSVAAAACGTAAFTVLFGGCVTHFLSGIVVGESCGCSFGTSTRFAWTISPSISLAPRQLLFAAGCSASQAPL